MAKKMDMTKLDRIREASVEIISEHGILNSSVASIAERAGVSVGYLYRHYPGKVDLINDLLEDALRTITDPDLCVGRRDERHPENRARDRGVHHRERCD